MRRHIGDGKAAWTRDRITDRLAVRRFGDPDAIFRIGKDARIGLTRMVLGEKGVEIPFFIKMPEGRDKRLPPER